VKVLAEVLNSMDVRTNPSCCKTLDSYRNCLHAGVRARSLGRISRYIDLKGFGGIRSSSRGDEAGLPVVYLAESPAGALLEVCVHTSSNDVPPTYTLLRVERPGTEFPSISEDSDPRIGR
jgi:hypothetical protein